MKKPIKEYPIKKLYNYNDCIKYIEYKYQLKIDHIFWHYMIDNNCAELGSSFFIEKDEIFKDKNINKIINLLRLEFSKNNDSIEFWVDG